MFNILITQEKSVKIAFEFVLRDFQTTILSTKELVAREGKCACIFDPLTIHPSPLLFMHDRRTEHQP